MDTTKWKSVLTPRDLYEELVVIARVEGRKNDQNYIAEQVESFKKESGSPINSKSFSI